MKRSRKLSSSFDAAVHGTFRDTEEKKTKLTGQMDLPLNTKSESQTCTESEITEDTDVSTYSPLIQRKDVSQTQWISDTREPLVPTWKEQMFKSHLDKDYCIKQHEQKETQKTASFHSSTPAPWDVPTLTHNTEQYNMFNPTRNKTARSEPSTRGLLGFYSSQDYGVKQPKQRERERTGKMLLGSQLVSPVKHKREKSEKTASLLSQIHAPTEGPSWKDPSNTPVRTARSKEHEQEESEQTTSVLSDIVAPWEVSTMTRNTDHYNMYNPIGNMIARNKKREESIFDQDYQHHYMEHHEKKETGKRASLLSDAPAPWDVPMWNQGRLWYQDYQDYDAKQYKQREKRGKESKKPKLLVHSQSVPHVKHKRAQTEAAASLLSDPYALWELPTWEQNTDPYNLHNPSKNITATKTTANVRSPGDGLELTRSRSVPEQSHSGYPPLPSCSHSITSFLADSPCPDSSIEISHSEEIMKHNNMEPETMSDDDYKLSVPFSLPQFSTDRDGPWKTSCSLPCSHSMVSLSKRSHAKNNFTQINSSLDTLLKEFTPVITDDFDDEIYRFQCSCPGLYQCSVTGLVFNMKGEGDVVYRTVPWNRRLLAQQHKKPAGPLFDIKCLQQSVCQLHLPHCEIISTGGGQSLQVAHVNDEGIEFISPHQITEAHVVISITGFSDFGNVKDEDSPPDPVRALVLVFYKPPEDPDLRSFLSVLLLPQNIVFRKMMRDRRKSDKNERYIETSPYCYLHPKQLYTLYTAPEDDLIKVQPKEAAFDEEYHDSYFPSFQVVLKRLLTEINLSLRDKSSSNCVWEREVCLLPTRGKTVTLKTLDTDPKKRPSELRCCFIKSVSGPVLSSLLDKLQEKTVITTSEREEADVIQTRSDRARFVFDTVSNKGEAASSEMIEFLCEEDPFLCEHLGLKQNGEMAHANRS